MGMIAKDIGAEDTVFQLRNGEIVEVAVEYAK